MAPPGGLADGASATCARCNKHFEGIEDRRAQLRSPDLCRACHLDPRARALPLDTDLGKGWLGRCARTFVQLIVSPSASFRGVDEPVSHARVLAFLATLRLPLWLVAVAWAGGEWALSDAPPQLHLPSVIGVVMKDAQFADVLRLWLLLLVPLGLPSLYFLGGILAHIGMALTGGARRSIGASMRAFGLALAPSLLLVAIADLLVVGLGVSPELWLGFVVAAVVLAIIWLAIAMARTHSTSVFRGLLVTILPIAMFVAVTGSRGLLEFSRLPFGEPPPIDSYAPYPIK